STPATYECRYVQQNTTTSVANSLSFSVNMGGYVVSGPGTVLLGASFAAIWTAPVGHHHLDWIGLFKQGDPDTAYVSWGYTYSHAASGAVTLTGPFLNPGLYELRYFLIDGWEKVGTSAQIIVL